MTETGSVAVVADEGTSPLNELLEGDKGAVCGLGRSIGVLLTEPAFELAVLWGALTGPFVPRYIADPSEYNDEKERRLLLPSVSLGGFRLASGRVTDAEGSDCAPGEPLGFGVLSTSSSTADSLPLLVDSALSMLALLIPFSLLSKVAEGRRLFDGR